MSSSYGNKIDTDLPDKINTFSSGSNDYASFIYTTEGSASFTTETDITCDFLIVGGGGSGGDIAVLIFDNQVVDTSSGKWVLVSTSTASGGGSGFVNPATTDLDMNTWDIIDICAIKFDNADGTELNSTDYGMEVYGNDLRYNIYGGVSETAQFTIQNGGSIVLGFSFNGS